MTPVTEWLALLRVHEGGVAWQSNRYLNHGSPMIKYVADAIDQLLETHVLAIGPLNEYGQQRVIATAQSQARYAELCHTQDPHTRNG